MTLKCFTNCRYFQKPTCCIGCKHLKDKMCNIKKDGKTIECSPIYALKLLNYKNLANFIKINDARPCNIEKIMTKEEKRRVMVEMI